jgi:hypothetical protein
MIGLVGKLILEFKLFGSDRMQWKCFAHIMSLKLVSYI